LQDVTIPLHTIQTGLDNNIHAHEDVMTLYGVAIGVAIDRLTFWQVELQRAIERDDGEQVARYTMFADAYKALLPELAAQFDDSEQRELTCRGLR